MSHHSSSPFVQPGERLGATGDFPEGKVNPEDEGGIRFGVAADCAVGKVIMHFGKAVAWVGMNPEQAIQLADSLKSAAQKILDDAETTTVKP